MSTPHADNPQPALTAWTTQEAFDTGTAETGGPKDPSSPSSPASDEEHGDILYGAKAIARFLFGADGRKEQRRVFNLWSHYQYRKERVGLFKLKGAVCLSKCQWRNFHGR